MWNHFEILLDNLVSEEEKHLDKITKNIQRYELERLEIRRDLNLFVDNEDSFEAALSLIDVEFKLRMEVHQLREEKSQRLKIFHEARDLEKELCRITGSLPLSGEAIHFARIPSEHQIGEIGSHIKQLKELRLNRENEFSYIIRNILELFQKLETEPNTSFEREIVCEDISKIVLSEDTMEMSKKVLQSLEDKVDENYVKAVEIISRIHDISEKLKIPYDNYKTPVSSEENFYSTKDIDKLSEELKVLEEQRLQHLPLFIKNARQELLEQWDKCYVDDSIKEAFHLTLEKKVGDEEALGHYEFNIRSWKQYFKNHEAIFSKVNEWYELWAVQLELETCAKDPTRYGNFRALREEEKRRNRVNKRLPKVVEEIESLTKQFRREQDKEFLINGQTFDQVNIAQKTKHEIDVQKQKDKKKEERRQMMVQETIYGVTKTPNRTKPTVQNQVKRLKNVAKPIVKDVVSTPSSARTSKIPPRRSRTTPRRKPLIDLNETFVSGSDAGQTPIAPVRGNIFNHANIISSTLKTEELRATVPRPRKIKRKVEVTGSATPIQGRSRVLRSGKKIPFIL